MLPRNAASQFRKLGFREEGYARQFLRIDGEWQDHVLYGLLATDQRPTLDAVPLHPRRDAEPPAAALAFADRRLQRG